MAAVMGMGMGYGKCGAPTDNFNPECRVRVIRVLLPAE